MTLTEMNHFITAVKQMLDALETAGAIDGVDNHNLLPVIVRSQIDKEAIRV